MSIKIKVIPKASGDCFAIWIDGDEGFDEAAFLTLLGSLGPSKSERIQSSFGPAELIREVHTEYGVLHISQEFDEFAGTTLYSESHALMEKILGLMVSSGQYQDRK